MTCLYAQDLDLAEFIQLLRDATWPEDSILMAFSPATARFEFFQFDAHFLPTTDQGRIFSPIGELKWRRVNGRLRVVYLGEPLPSLSLQNHPQELASLNPNPVYEELILWGVRTDLQNEWLEQQVPQFLVYPLVGATYPRGRVALKVEHWVEKERPIPRFSRYHSLKEIEGD